MIRICSCAVRGGIANFMSQSVRHRHAKTRNPFKKVEPLAVKLEEPERSGPLGSDFSGSYEFDDIEEDPETVLEHVEHYYDRHMDELRFERKKVRRAVVRRKYFKEIFPPETNLLTWAAKQQIHYLHILDPSEWTAERIAECFPVSVRGAKKLLKSRFTTATAERIAEHDKHVQLKWKALKTGKADEKISPTTKKLYLEGKLQEDQAYGNKTLPMPDQQSDIKALELSRHSTKPGEYSKLIAPYLKLKNPEKRVPDKKYEQASFEQQYEDIYTDDVAAATTLKRKGSQGMHVRIDEYKAATIKKPEQDARHCMDFSTAKHVSASEHASDTVSASLQGKDSSLTVEGATKHDETFDILEAFKYKRDDTRSQRASNEIAKDYKYSADNEEVLQRRITIPSHLKNQGSAVHRVGKCYYDDDGEILYKVP
ncbi:hypothetical protein HPB49_026004 [Dermacentor silvarum]|uniref:uncharacterized protein LOC119434880 n=1 Tax=Dermacentor silvarum TaxID=543639 RepID=UPI00189C1AE7|nr:uncharacterized protein LOC119434880 [Dermacentor silvarum]KAH7986359.1 hypothetical protein HPB49_026004 [Dermacentor silvarum]